MAEAYALHEGAFGRAIVLELRANLWLDERRNATGSLLLFRSPGLPLDQGLRRACWQVLHLIVSGDGTRESIDTELERLLAAAIEASAMPTAAPQPAGSISSGNPIGVVALDRRLRAAISLMREHVADKVTIDQIGRRVGLSRAHLFAVFRSQLNTTSQVFWSAVRVEEAMRRLVNEGEPLIDVALDLGFSAPGNFSRFFEEHTGASPSLFRRAAREPLLTPMTGISE